MTRNPSRYVSAIGSGSVMTLVCSTINSAVLIVSLTSLALIIRARIGSQVAGLAETQT